MKQRKKIKSFPHFTKKAARELIDDYWGRDATARLLEAKVNVRWMPNRNAYEVFDDAYLCRVVQYIYLRGRHQGRKDVKK